MSILVNPEQMLSLQIYLCGFSGRKLDKLRRLINSGGGVRFNQLNEDVTHVIVGDYEDDLRLFWSRSSHRSCQSSLLSTWCWDGLVRFACLRCGSVWPLEPNWVLFV